MSKFGSLPLELTPLVLQNLMKPNDLAAACLVSRTFREFTSPILYSVVRIYSWRKDAKARESTTPSVRAHASNAEFVQVLQLFSTLARCPRIAQHVHVLEVRDFPKVFRASTAKSNLDIVYRGLRNCTNLQSCTWTRDGSLNSDILEALSSCPHLLTLEINGHSNSSYDPKSLLNFNQLKRLSVIMASPAVVGVFPSWMNHTGPSLRHLTLVCKSSPSITDTILESLAPSLVYLQTLHIAGCPKVTHSGIWALISTNIGGIQSLGLEGLSQKLDMAELNHRCSGHNTLRRLESITLTVDSQTPLDSWTENIVVLLSKSPLKTFQIYSSGPVYEATLGDAFWSRIVDHHGPHLMRFSVHRIGISLDAIDDICKRCIVLEELFLVVEQTSLRKLANALAQLSYLRIVHLNYSPETSSADSDSTSLMNEALDVARRCSTTLVQFGCNTRVWQVVRIVTVDSNGEKSMLPGLSAYENPQIPEAFLVVRA